MAALRRSFAGVLATAAVLASATAAAAPGFAPIPLPIPDPAPGSLAAALGIVEPGEAVLVAPGPITDDEAVTVTLSRDGHPTGVSVDQRLVVTGTGDFRLRIPGPARDVRALPGSTQEPGLQRGSVIWEGFAAGKRELGARIDLDADQEQFRLPITLTVTRKGNRSELRFHNQTTQPVEFVDAEPEPGDLAAAGRAVAAVLAAGRRPLAGTGPVPATLGARSSHRITRADVAAPLLIHGSVLASNASVPLSHVVDEIDAIVNVEGAVTGLEFTVTTALPALTLERDTGTREALARLERLLAKTARAAGLDAYLGNPNPGSSRTTFRYRIAASAAPVHRPDPGPQPATLALAGLAALMVVATGVLWWRVN